MAAFFQTNRVVIYFLYGEAFFILGLAIALQSRKRSQLALAKWLWLLAVFGIVHAIYEWGSVFIPIQQAYLPAEWIQVLRVVQLVLGAISFLAMFQFGAELLLPQDHPWRIASALPTVIFVAWVIVVIWEESSSNYSLDQVLVLADVLMRYALAVPGALAAAWGLWRQAHLVREMDLPRITNYFRGAAYAFVGYSAVSAIVPSADFFPASFINYDTIVSAVGIPAPVFRGILGGAIAYLIIRGLEIFDVETDRLLEEVAQARAIAADRERIGRELHDGIIQSLYAAGLLLEDASLGIDEDKEKAQGQMRQVIAALNRAIGDVRRYILDLRGEGESGDWTSALGELVREFRLDTLVDAELEMAGTPSVRLAREREANLLTIVREALTNVGKHAQATRVDVTVDCRPGEIRVAIRDNGIGFSPNGKNGSNEAGEHQGLRNMRERAALMGARLDVTSESGQGTRVRITVPL